MLRGCTRSLQTQLLQLAQDRGTVGFVFISWVLSCFKMNRCLFFLLKTYKWAEQNAKLAPCLCRTSVTCSDFGSYENVWLKSAAVIGFLVFDILRRARLVWITCFSGSNQTPDMQVSVVQLRHLRGFKWNENHFWASVCHSRHAEGHDVKCEETCCGCESSKNTRTNLNHGDMTPFFFFFF